MCSSAVAAMKHHKYTHTHRDVVGYYGIALQKEIGCNCKLSVV